MHTATMTQSGSKKHSKAGIALTAFLSVVALVAAGAVLVAPNLEAVTAGMAALAFVYFAHRKGMRFLYGGNEGPAVS